MTRELGLEGYSRNPAVSINHLLKRIVRFEKNMYVLQRGWETGQLLFSASARTGQGARRGFLRDIKGRMGRIANSSSYLLLLGYWEGHSGSQDGTSRHDLVGDGGWG